MLDYQNHSILQESTYSTGRITHQTFFPGKSKSIINKIDIVLGELYGFDKHEIDYIINYNIDFRMNKD